MVGRSHSSVTLSEAVLLMSGVARIQDMETRKQAEDEILLKCSSKDAFTDIYKKLDSIELKNEDQLDDAENLNLIKKELSLLDPSLNEYLGGENIHLAGSILEQLFDPTAIIPNPLDEFSRLFDLEKKLDSLEQASTSSPDFPTSSPSNQ
jgi:hypothetical protein